MAIINAGNLSSGLIINQVIAALKAHRDALETLADFYRWTSTVSAADLEASPINMSVGDANAILSAVADAHAEFLIHTTGQPPNTYPQASSAYVYGQSQDSVIGPNVP